MKAKKVSDIEKYCKMCGRHEYCPRLNNDKPDIDTCIVNSGIEIGYKKAIEDAERRAKIACCKMRTLPLFWNVLMGKILAYVIHDEPIEFGSYDDGKFQAIS